MNKNRKTKKIIINRFNNFDNKVNETEVKSFYNLYPKKRLENSSGVDKAVFPITSDGSGELFELDFSTLSGCNVKGVSYFKQFFPLSGNTWHRLLVYGEDQKLYIHQLLDGDNCLYWLYSLTFGSTPLALSFKKDDLDTIVLASNDKMVVWETDYIPYTIEDVPIITSMCYGDDKVLYCTIVEPAYKIWYAYDISYESIGNISATSNYLSLEDELGYARKILNFDENIYVFRDYGITKINHIGNKFTTYPVYSASTKIYANTISVCGNTILFMTREGLYAFNGIKVSKCDIELSKMLTNLGGNEVASSLGDKYYLALRLDFNDDNQILCETGDYKNNAILIVDISDFSYQIIRGVDVGCMYALKIDAFEKMLLTFNSGETTRIGEIVDYSNCFDNHLPKYWGSGLLTDGLNKKIFTKISLIAEKDVKINFIYDNNSLSFTTYQDGYNEFCFKVIGNSANIEISSESESSIVDEVNIDYYEY